MATVEKISIALPPKMVSIVRQAIEIGEYASSSEVVRDALRDRGLRDQDVSHKAYWRLGRSNADHGEPDKSDS